MWNESAPEGVKAANPLAGRAVKVGLSPPLSTNTMIYVIAHKSRWRDARLASLVAHKRKQTDYES